MNLVTGDAYWMITEALYYLSIDYSHLILSVALLLVIAPFERFFPRIQNASVAPRLLAIFTIAICAYSLVWVFKNAIYHDIIAFFRNFQILSISKMELPAGTLFGISILLIDFLAYLFHFLSHKIGILWKFHAVHHADEHVTASSGLLHHPMEALFSVVFLALFAVVLGIPVLALIVYAGFATVINILTHSNIAIPGNLNAVLRLVFITPDIHRTHHSVKMDEGNSNFGHIFSVWDRAFGTYVAHPSVPEEKLKMGLPKSERPEAFTAKSLLLHPFVKLMK